MVNLHKSEKFHLKNENGKVGHCQKWMSGSRWSYLGVSVI